MSVESIRDQSTNAVMPNPFAAEWATRQGKQQAAELAKTAVSSNAGQYSDTTQKLAQATLLALRQQSNPPQTKSSVARNIGTYTHRPVANSGVNNTLTLSSINTLPAFQTFMSQMFETLKTINNVPPALKTINSLNKDSTTGLTIAFNNYYHQGYDQDSFDLLASKLKYLAEETKKALDLPSPSVTQPKALTPGQKSPEFSKDSTSAPKPNSDNLVTNPQIQKLNESFNSLASSLQGNVCVSSLASFVQNLQHQAHGFSGSGNVVNTSA